MNTKDTPMDYKQFEGHTPGPWEVFNTFSDGFAIDFNDGNLMRRFVAFKIYNKGDAALIATAPDLLKENQELKLELQKQKEKEIRGDRMIVDLEHQKAVLKSELEKQKELNAELVKVSNNNKCELLDRYTEFLKKEGYIDTDATMEHPTAIDIFLKKDRANESLIKKSSEI